MKTFLRFSITLFIICLVAAGSLSLINQVTQEKILAQIKQEQEAALSEVMPEADNFQEVKKDDQILYYKAFKNGEFIGLAFKAKGKGYSSVIETMAGMDLEARITGIKIISQNETPGLGSRIIEVAEEITLVDVLKAKKKEEKQKKPWFCEQFKEKNIANLDKEVQAITGATISSEAVIKSVKEEGLKILKLFKNE